MGFIIHKPFERGITELYGLPEQRVQTLAMGIATLEAGDRFGETLNRREGIIVLLHGRVTIKGHGFDHGEIESGADASASEGLPAVIYCPPGLYAMKAMTPAEAVIFRCDCDKKYKGRGPMVLDPSGFVRREMASGTATAWQLHLPVDTESSFCVGETRTRNAIADLPPIPDPEGADPRPREALLYHRILGTESPTRIAIASPDLEKNTSETLGDSTGMVLPSGCNACFTRDGGETLSIWATARIG